MRDVDVLQSEWESVVERAKQICHDDPSPENIERVRRAIAATRDTVMGMLHKDLRRIAAI